jgi:hypothetical protein
LLLFPLFQLALHEDWPCLLLVFVDQRVPSGKRLHNYGKSPFSMGKSTINGNFNPLFLWPFSIAFCMFTRGYELESLVPDVSQLPALNWR